MENSRQIEDAAALVRAGKYTEARELLAGLLKLDPGSVEGLTWMATVERLLKNFEESRRLCVRVLEVVQLGSAWAILGQCDLDQQDYDSAESNFWKAIRLEPNASIHWNNLALALEANHGFMEAIDCYRRALSLEPRATQIRLSLAHCLLRIGKKEQAVEEFSFIAQHEPSRQKALMAKAKIAMIQDRPEEARAHCVEVLKDYPSYTPAVRLLSAALQQLGRFGEAGELLKTLLARDPNNFRALSDLAFCGKAGMEGEWLIEELQGALCRSPKPRDAMSLNYALGKTLDDLDRYSEARPRFELANTTAFQLRTQAYDENKDNQAVERICRLGTRGFLDKARPFASSSRRPIFIVGMIRSGTTLLEKLISSHEEVTAGGEISYWTDRREELLTLGAGTAEQEGTRLVPQYEEVLKKISQDGFVTDKMPTNFRVLGFMHGLYPEARIIHIRRDPRDTAVSIFTTPYPEPLDWAHDLRNIASFYKNYLKLMQHWRTTIPVQSLLEIDYEDLVNDLTKTIDVVWRFLGLAAPRSEIIAAADGSKMSTPSKWQARQPIYKSSVGRWRHYPEWIAQFGSDELNA